MKLHAGCVVGLAAIAAACAAAPSTHAATLPSGFEQRTELSGLTRPTKIAWAPDGRRFVTEKDGIVRVAPATGTASQVLLDIRSHVNNVGDRGLLGLAVDSDFANNPYIYISYTYDVRHASNQDTAAATVARVERLRINAVSQVTERKVLLGSYVSGPCPPASNDIDCMPADGTSHSIGTVISNPGGTLYVGNGDAAGFVGLDTLSLRTYDDASMAGKILHVDRDGRGLPGHPLCLGQTDLTKVCTKVWAKGFRNPFRFTRRPNGILMVGDVGWNTMEEMNAVWQGGRSFGWPCYEGTIQTPTWRQRSECQPEYAKHGTDDAHRPPIHAYSHAGSASSAIQAGPEYTGGPYPDDYDGQVFYGDYGKGFIKRMKLRPDGWYDGTIDFATDWHGVDLTAAPNGDLTWADGGDWDTGGGSIERVVYAVNHAPKAVIAANPVSGNAPLRVTFNGGGSTDPDGDALTYSWTFGDGKTSTQQSPEHVYTEDGSYTARLTVSDGEASHSATVRIDVNNTAPAPRIDQPANGSLYRGGVPVTLRGSAPDAQDGSVPADRLEWNVLLWHKDHVHPHANGTGPQLTFTPARDHDADSYYEVRLTATDTDEASDTTSIELRPETVPLHLRSEPAGAPLSYAGTSVTAPHDRAAAIGFLADVGAEESFESGGRTWVFDRWSDGGERAHVLSVPAAETTLTAIYRESSGPLMGPLPGSSLPDPPPPGRPLTSPSRRDVTGPRIGFHAGRGLVLGRRLLRGVADDRAGVKAVSVALAGRSRGGCRWLVPKPRRLARRASSCARPRWVAATVHGRRWKVRLPKAMGAGRYRLRFKATDGLDNASRRLRDGRASVRLRVP